MWSSIVPNRRNVSAAKRQMVLARAGGKCECCNTVVRHNCEIDHIVPLWAGGTNDLANLQCMCAAQHANKSADERLLRAMAYKLGDCMVCGCPVTEDNRCSGPPFDGVYYEAGGLCIPITQSNAPKPIEGFTVSKGKIQCKRCLHSWPTDITIANRSNLLQHRKSSICKRAAAVIGMRKALARYVKTTPQTH